MEIKVIYYVLIALIALWLSITIFIGGMEPFERRYEIPSEYAVSRVYASSINIPTLKWNDITECRRTDCEYRLEPTMILKAESGPVAVSASFLGDEKFFGCIIDGSLQWPCEISADGASVGFSMWFRAGPPSLNASKMSEYNRKELLDGQKLIIGNFVIETKVRSWAAEQIFKALQLRATCQTGDFRLINLNYGGSAHVNFCDGTLDINVTKEWVSDPLAGWRTDVSCADISAIGGEKDGEDWGGKGDTLEIMFWKADSVFFERRCGGARYELGLNDVLEFDRVAAITDSACLQRFMGSYTIEVNVPEWFDLAGQENTEQRVWQPLAC